MLRFAQHDSVRVACFTYLRNAALVFIFFARAEDFSRSSLGPGWLELPILDCRLPIGKVVWQLPPLSTSPSTDGSIEIQHSNALNRQSARRGGKIVNR